MTKATMVLLVSVLHGGCAERAGTSGVDAADVARDLGRASGRDVMSDAGVDAQDVATDAEPWLPIGDGACRARERRLPIEPGVHVEPDAGPIRWGSNPPSSGPHYGTWARWGAHRDVARGYWVHNLEHGGVAFLYRCPTGTCDATRDALVAAAGTIPTDPSCMPTDAAPARVRVVITNDHLIETPVAAAAWGWVYAAECVDATSLRQFYLTRSGRAPEDFCADGSYPP